MIPPEQDLPLRLAALRERMDACARAAGRATSDVELLAVSKTHPACAVRAAYDAGLRLFGENRVQEATAKFTPALRADCPGLSLHLIGPLQTNKVRAAVALFDVIETVDRPALAEALARAMIAQGRAVRLLIEVNIGREPQKAGVMPEDAPGFLALCRQDLGLAIEGLLVLPPASADPRAHFRAARTLARDLGLSTLSMGMSGDLEAAIAEGATRVRIGTALFGARGQSRTASSVPASSSWPSAR